MMRPNPEPLDEKIRHEKRVALALARRRQDRRNERFDDDDLDEVYGMDDPFPLKEIVNTSIEK